MNFNEEKKIIPNYCSLIQFKTVKFIVLFKLNDADASCLSKEKRRKIERINP